MTSYTAFPNGITVENGSHIATLNATTYAPGAFAGGTTNARGDYDGTGNPVTLFSVTGVVMATVFGVCSVNLAGASATLEVGVTGNTAELIAQTTGTDIDANDIWRSATPDVLAGTLQDFSIVASDIIETVAAANLTAGTITYYCIWYPVSVDGNVTAGS